MIRYVLAAALLAAPAVGVLPAYADGVDDCFAACAKTDAACMAKAKEFVNDIEVSDAQALCRAAAPNCTDGCMQIEMNHGFDKPAPKKGETEEK